MRLTTLERAKEAKRLFDELHKPHLKKEYTQEIVGKKLFVSSRTVRSYLTY